MSHPENHLEHQLIITIILPFCRKDNIEECSTNYLERLRVSRIYHAAGSLRQCLRELTPWQRLAIVRGRILFARKSRLDPYPAGSGHVDQPAQKQASSS